MFLTKNKLKKKKVDDGIEYLNYMKYSHLDKPENKDTSIQTGIDTENIGVDTYDDLKALDGFYRLVLEEAKAFPHKRVDKQVQVFTEMLDRTKIKTPSPQSSGSEKDYPVVDTMAKMAYYTGKGLYHTGRLGLKAVDYMTKSRDRDEDEEDEEEEQQPTTTFLSSSTARNRSRSRDDEPTNQSAPSSNAPPPNNMGNRLLRRGASRSRDTTPDKKHLKK